MDNKAYFPMPSNEIEHLQLARWISIAQTFFRDFVYTNKMIGHYPDTRHIENGEEEEEHVIHVYICHAFVTLYLLWELRIKQNPEMIQKFLARPRIKGFMYFDILNRAEKEYGIIPCLYCNGHSNNND